MSDTVPYRVLARKYRPRDFDDLIGQEAMVRTLGNAFQRNRIAQAYLLTGVRGIGKTTTARIIARALNCIGHDGEGGPTIKPCGECVHCKDIMEDRDVDVVELDAASNNSVDNAREISEASRYRPVSARYKVYILDEAHMLTNQAFNALLKTLEEPPPHVKFIFATTEVRRLPVTVLSRCQRFDLRRVSPDQLTAHFSKIAEAEGAEFEEEAVRMIARAADGSVRDGLSLLDQAIALGDSGQPINAEVVREMLGLADRLAIYELLDSAMKGDASSVLSQFGEMVSVGAEPAAVLHDLMEAIYWTTRLSVDPKGVDFAGSSEAEQARASKLAGQLTVPILTRAWQLVSKGYSETMTAASPRLAGEMALIRLCYASNLPTPDDLIRRIENSSETKVTPSFSPSSKRGGGPNISGGSQAAALLAEAPEVEPISSPAPAQKPTERPVDAHFPDFESLVAWLTNKGAPRALTLLRRLRLVAFEPMRIVYETHDGLPDDFRKKLREELVRATGQLWVVEEAKSGGQLSTADLEKAADDKIRSHPLVQAALAIFPGSELKLGRPATSEADTNLFVPSTRDDENPDVVYEDDFTLGEEWEPEN